ncbi:type I-C CRISPR-associated protein Cas7/Csd2 [Microvirga thermotolerans]|uniref:Type I-C CRISPR-associated protein Cas7/Csd2 n=1 Tax=Microvirga thermotolerans TaxID=2651334 RepID=A0A5P9JT63_9HYPH|nr:type I-C CRISPR-associated protein Cas7/Csd2 [Microvirga thermotolerans]QFU15603.1 type I-C CRISPR-associated protein Cas7/Csd2 [Microvirga thermotolerans]
MSSINRRYDFVYLFDVADGNPNGDPDAGNLPRIDPETNQGLVTDVCLKRKIRNFVAMAKGETPGFDIYMTERAVLNRQHRRSYEALGIAPESKKLPKDRGDEITAWMCRNFYDIRTFGAVMTTDVNAGQVRGPVQIAFARSVEPVMPIEVSITRSSVTNEKDAERKDREMGRKHIVPYGLYRAHGYISGRLANDEKKGTGFSEEDLALFWQALEQMFDHDRSAARGEMAARKLIVFEHESDLGNAPASALFERVTVKRRRPNGSLQDPEGAPLNGGAREPLPPARSFSDYAVVVDRENLPRGVSLHERL